MTPTEQVAHWLHAIHNDLSVLTLALVVFWFVTMVYVTRRAAGKHRKW